MGAARVFEDLAIPGVIRVTPRQIQDGRGRFMETYRADRYREGGIEAVFVQDNQSLSHKRGTVRGLHFQAPPMAQAKLIRCLNGAIWDVAVDLRAGSPTYGQHCAVELRADRGDQLFVPAGCAHGFCTLEDETEVHYKCSAPYAPDLEGGVYWADPDLGIDWPVAAEAAILSQKDHALPRLADLVTPFSVEMAAR